MYGFVIYEHKARVINSRLLASLYICFQFPPVYENKKAIIIAPTISLMQDQVHKLTELGIPSVFLGSAQLGKSLEVQALMPDSKQLIVFVTPEWVTKAAN